MESIATVPSRKQALRIISEIVGQSSGWVVTGKTEVGPIYTKDDGTRTEKLYAREKSSRRWQIIKEDRSS